MEEKKSILLLTNLTSQMNRGTAVSETLNSLLSAKGWKIIAASGKVNKVSRLLDMLAITWKYKAEYDGAFVEVYSGEAFIWAEFVCLLLRLLHKPYILGLFGGNLPSFAAKNPHRVDHLLGHASISLSPTSYLLKQLRPYTSAKIMVFPYGVDLDRFRFRSRISAQPKLIALRGFHSIYCPWQGVETLALLKDEFPNIKLVMTGGDKHDGSLERTEEIIRENAIEQSVTITGFLRKLDLETYLASADILINTPIIDNTPVSVIQAMACGLCVVSTNVGGLPDLIENEVDGLLVPPNDPKAIATAVRRVLTEPGLAERLSSNARKKAEGFDWSVVLPKWEHLFSTLIQPPP